MLYSLTAKYEPRTILITADDGRIHVAQVTIRSFKSNPITGLGYTRKYLYLKYRDGKSVKQIYLGKLA